MKFSVRKNYSRFFFPFRTENENNRPSNSINIALWKLQYRYGIFIASIDHRQHSGFLWINFFFFLSFSLAFFSFLVVCCCSFVTLFMWSLMDCICVYTCAMRIQEFHCCRLATLYTIGIYCFCCYFFRWFCAWQFFFFSVVILYLCFSFHIERSHYYLVK